MTDDYLTIGKFAQVMQVSIHQISYFEEKGILQPAKIDYNGYRLYGESEMYQLANILLLRSLNVSVKEIKQFQQEESSEKLHQNLLLTLEKIEKEILVLEETRNRLKNVLNIEKNVEERSNIVIQPQRFLKKVGLVTNETSNLKELAEVLKKTTIPLFKQNFFYLLTDLDEEWLYIENENDYDYILEAGDYLVKNILIMNQEELEKAVKQFKAELLAKKIPFTNMIIQEHSYPSIYYAAGIFYSLEVRRK